ncbi:MAG TPA: methyltransferase domain-containing protein [Caldilineaceae bacterium]|nr:methyltransferase domain-containing protein [Caldilineaceae bacterium]
MTTETYESFYSIADAEAQRMYVGVRRAQPWISFLLPYLHPGMTVLDCGCGVGSITLDIAERVHPGRVVGIDIDETQLVIARKSAAERGLSNVLFEPGDVYHLHFADASFHAVLAHTLLIHLRNRSSVLREFYRVLRPDGVVGIADDDYATIVYSPADPRMQQFFDLWIKILQYNGGDPFYSRHLRHELLQAGFARTAGHAVAADYRGTLEETRQGAAIVGRLLRDPDITNLIISQGWLTQAELDAMIDWMHQWGELPDAFLAVGYCAAVGWKS